MSENDVEGDIVTQMTTQLQYLSEQLVNFLGCLEREAPPASVGGEAVETPQEPSAVFKETLKLPDAIVKASLELDGLINALPNDDTVEEQQLKAITTILEENNALGAQLEDELTKTQARLSEVQDMFRTMGLDVLSRSCAQKARALTSGAVGDQGDHRQPARQ